MGLAPFMTAAASLASGGGGSLLGSMVITWESVGLSTEDGANILRVCSRTSSLRVNYLQNCMIVNLSCCVFPFDDMFPIVHRSCDSLLERAKLVQALIDKNING